jgi:hypothetical protein
VLQLEDSHSNQKKGVLREETSAVAFLLPQEKRLLVVLKAIFPEEHLVTEEPLAEGMSVRQTGNDLAKFEKLSLGLFSGVILFTPHQLKVHECMGRL